MSTALIPVNIGKRVGLHSPVEILKCLIHVILADLHRSPGTQHDGIIRSHGQSSVKITRRYRQIAHLEGILPSTQVSQHIIGLGFQVTCILYGRLFRAVVYPQRISQPQSCLMQVCVPVQRRRQCLISTSYVAPLRESISVCRK